MTNKSVKNGTVVYETTLENLIELNASTTLGEKMGLHNLYDENGNLLGVGIGIPFNPNTFIDENLPQPNENKRSKEISFAFDLRIFYDENGKLKLVFSRKGSGIHHEFSFEGLTEKQASKALRNFDRKLFNYVIPQMLNHHAWACYRKQDENFKKREESYKSITENHNSLYKQMLLPKREKSEKGYKENGVGVKEFTLVESGRNPKTESEILQEKKTFLSEIFDAFEKWQKKGNRRMPKQKDLSFHFSWKERDKEKKLSEKLKLFGLNFKDLLKVFSETSNKEKIHKSLLFR